MKAVILVFLVLSAYLVNGQNISGQVFDQDATALPGASLSLRNARDSSLVKISLSDKAGQYSFVLIPAGQYIIHGTFTGRADFYSTPFDFNGSEDYKVADIRFRQASGDLKAVTVVSRKPMVEVKADKTILNVEGSINAVGQDALELLRKAPGVLVDKDDNLSLSGKNGVQVYIDGRPTPLSGKDLSDYLKTIQSSSVESIEIITNPSAKYEAAGNAGIINIRLKKNKSFGTNGSITTGYNIGILPKYNAGLSLNHRNKKFNAFANYNYNYGRNESFMNLYRLQLDTLFNGRNTMTFENNSHNFKTGVDYFINSKNTLGIMVNGNISDNSFANYSRTDISYQPTSDPVKVLVADNNNAMTRDHANVNVNYKYADTSGRELNLDADYGLYRINSDQLQPNFYFDPSGNPLEQRIYNMIAPTDIDIYSLKGDYEQGFKKGRLGVGGKVSYVETTNDFRRFNVNGSSKDLDRDRSNDFNYKENINAAYVNYNRQFKGFMIQAGVRVENTVAEGISNGQRWNGGSYITYDSGFKRNYTDVFPSAALTLNKNPMSQFSFTYSRRIDRPAYQDLNPFEFKLDEYTYQKGNTELRPQYTNSFGITHTFKYKLNTTLNYSHVSDVFTQLIDTAEKSKSFITKKNLATQDITSLNISYPLQIKWYSVYTNLNMYYTHYKANFGVGRTIDLDVYAFNIFTQHSAKLGKGWTAEASGWYGSPSIWQGTFESKEMWSIEAGVQKTLFKGKGNLKASVSDIFQTMRWEGISNFAGQYLRVGGGWESRQLKLNFTYRFGSAQIKAARQRKTGLDDENKRVGSQGGGISN
jgi:iron complex outermembrane receptor protein